MANRLLTDEIIEEEGKQFFRSLGVPYELKFKNFYKMETDEAWNVFYVQTHRAINDVRFPDNTHDRTMSIHNYFEKLMKRQLLALADYLGYATWD